MPVKLTVTDIEMAAGVCRVMGTVAFSGSYPTGGDALDLTTLFGQISAQGSALDSTLQPFCAYFESLNGGYGTSSTAKTGGYYVPVKGATTKTWLLQLFDAGGSERAAAVYPGGVLADVVTFEIGFRRPQ